MIYVWPVYAMVMAAVLVRAWYSGSIALRIAGFVLATDWLVTNMMRWYAPFDSRTIFPVSDLAFAALFFIMWTPLRSPLMAVVASLYVISSLVGCLAYGPGSKYSFDLALNAAFLARLAVVWISLSEPRKNQQRT